MTKVQVCRWKACKTNFSEYIIKRLQGDKERLGLSHLEIEEAKCMGMCKRWPNVVVDEELMNYSEPAKVSERVINWPKKIKKKYNKK